MREESTHTPDSNPFDDWEEEEAAKPRGKFENVRLTDSALKDLEKEYGKERTAAAVDLLDGWLQEDKKRRRDYETKDHAMSIRNWVLRALDDRAKRSPSAVEIGRAPPGNATCPVDGCGGTIVGTSGMCMRCGYQSGDDIAGNMDFYRRNIEKHVAGVR